VLVTPCPDRLTLLWLAEGTLRPGDAVCGGCRPLVVLMNQWARLADVNW
jgi:hypothetical protein